MKKSPTIVSLSLTFACLGLMPAAVRAAADAPKQPVTLTGCLSGPDEEGGFELTTGSQKVLIGAPVDVLRENAGKEVRVTGTWLTTGEGKAGASEHEGSSAKVSALKAEKIEPIATECQTK